MKKIFFAIFFFFLYGTVFAKELVSATFVRCDNSDTFIFLIEDIEVPFTFLGIDYLENDFVCNWLNDSISILLEYDSTQSDELGRSYAWIWTDEKLLQELVIRGGYGKVSGSNYKYTKELCKIQDDIIGRKIGIWENSTDKGICATVDYSVVSNYIFYDEIPQEIEKTPTEEITDSLEKIDDALTNITDNNMDKITKYYLYGFVLLAFVVFIIREIKK